MIPERRTITLGLIAASVALTLMSGCGQQPAVSIGGPFQLTDQDGRPRDQSMLKGKWSAVFFGYTYCPDVCPTTLQTLAEAQDRLGPKAGKFQVVFISVDPERDTPAQLRSYLSSSAFPRGAVGLTGTSAQIADVAKAYHAFYQKQGSGSGYEVQHGSTVYLMDPKGRFSSVIAFGLTPDEVARQISEKMSG
jgi:protein SCO1/2